MSASCALRQAVFSLFVFAATVMSASAQGVGAIAGTVTDASGAVLPGATVTLTSAQGTVGGNREVATDERGAYQFLRLVPGTYSVKASLQGFRPFTQAGITVNSDQTSRADARLEIGTMEEGIVVSGEAPLLDTHVGAEADRHHAGGARSAAQPHGRVGDHAGHSEHHGQQG